MKYRATFVYLVLLHAAQLHSAAIVAKRGSGRLGDNLLMYAKAKWVATKYDLDLYVEWFEYADEFVFWDQEKHYTPEIAEQFKTIQTLQALSDIDTNSPTLYEVYLEFKAEGWSRQKCDITRWHGLSDDSNFVHMLQNLIRSRTYIPFEPLPGGIKTVALHVRKGGGFDPPLLSKYMHVTDPLIVRMLEYADRVCALKFPPDSFYIDSLALLSELLGNPPLYVHIFTDDKDPQAIQKKYTDLLQKPNIYFSCRQEGNAHDSNVLDDLFSMMRFEYLIRPDSSFSRLTQLLHPYHITIFPHKSVWQDDTLHITELAMSCANKNMILKQRV